MKNYDNYISLEETAEYIGVKPVTLRGWIKDKSYQIPVHRVGKFRKFKCSELDEWINSGKSAIK